MLAGKGVNRNSEWMISAGKGAMAISEGQGTDRAGQDF